MDLTDRVVKQFVTAAKTTETPKNTSTYGTVVVDGSLVYVKFDGSDYLTPVAMTMDAKDGDRVMVSVENHSAVITGNISSPGARVDDLNEVAVKTDENGNQILAQNNTITAIGNTVNAQNNTIDAQNNKITLIDSQIESQNSQISIINSTISTQGSQIATINSTIDTQNSRIATIDSTVATQNSRITTIDSTIETQSSQISTISSSVDIYNSSFQVTDGVVTGIKGIDTDWITTSSLEADHAVINSLSGDFASYKEVVATELTAAKAWMLEGAIGDAQISSVSANKLSSGTIDTSLVTIKGTDGNLTIADNTIQIKDGDSVVRVQVGKDDSGDYTLAVWDADGNLIWDALGATENTIQRAIIRDKMVADDAEIQAKKIDYQSFNTALTDQGVTISGTVVQVGDKTLTVALSEQSQTITDQGETLADHETRIAANEDEIKLKVSSQTFETYQSTVTQNISDAKSSAIDTAASDATTKANQALTDAKSYTATEVSTINKHLSTTDSEIEILQTNIALKVEQTDIDKAVTETKTYTDTAVDNLSIGGRNLLWNSTFKNEGAHWTLKSAICSYGSDSVYGNYILFYCTAAGNDTDYRVYQTPFADNKNAHIVGQEYTLSFYAKASEAVTVHAGVSSDLGSFSVTTSWQRFTRTYTASSSYSLMFYIDTANVKLYLSKIKLEFGNKPTDWTPAPEDVTAYTDSTAETLTTKYTSAIELAKSGILSTVSETYAKQTDLTSANNKISTLETWKTEASSAITKEGIINTVGSYYAKTTELDDALAAIAVGARNYALDTGTPLIVTGTNASNQCVTIYEMSCDWQEFAGEYVTLSFDYELTGGGNALTDGGGNALTDGGGNTVTDGTGSTTFTAISLGLGASPWNRWVKIPVDGATKGHVTGTLQLGDTITSHSFIQGRFDYLSGSVTISNLKLEKGTLETDWTPAPEDIETRMTAAESKITQNADSIELKVSQDGVISAINQTAETITIDASKVNLSGYVTFTNLATSGETTIDGGNIKAQSITAEKMVLADYTNYADLNINTYESYGFTKVTDSSASYNPWFKMKTVQRDTPISPKKSYENYPSNGGETFRIEFQVSSNVQGYYSSSSTSLQYLNINVGLYCKTMTGVNAYYIPTGAKADSSGTPQTISVTATLGSNIRAFGVYIQVDGTSGFTGDVLIRNVRVTKMYGGSLIVDGSITAAKIDVNDLFAQNITATGTISGVTLSGATGSFSGTVTASYITANYGKIANFTITDGFIFNGINIGTAKSCGIGAGTSLGGNDEWIFWAGNGNFRVNINGYAYLNNAAINGTITATSIKLCDTVQIYKTSSSSYVTLIDQSANNINIGLSYTTLTTPAIVTTGYVYAESGEIISASLGGGISTTSSDGGQFRAVGGDYGFMIRNDGSDTYFLLTSNGNAYGSWNDLRPFYINNSTSAVTMATTKYVKGTTYLYDSGGLCVLFFNSNSNFIPMTSSLMSGSACNVVNIGSDSNYFKSVYYGTALTKKSDRRLKNDLGDLPEDEALTLLTSFQAKKFTMKDDKDSVIQYGAYAQDVRDTLISSGIGHRLLLGIGDVAEDKPVYDLTAPEEDVSYSLDYTQYIPVIIKGWQMHDTELAVADSRLTAAEAREDSMQYQLQQAFEQIAKLQKQIEQLQASA